MRTRIVEDFLYADFVWFGVTDKKGNTSVIICLGTEILQCYGDKSRSINRGYHCSNSSAAWGKEWSKPNGVSW